MYRSAIVFGGYGQFGGLVVRELVRMGVPVTIAGRDLAKAVALARELGPLATARAADTTDSESCRAAIAGHAVAVTCAGPRGPALAEACLESGVHYADIIDDRGYATAIRGMSARFAERGIAAVYGCSSLPGISLALGDWQMEADRARRPLRARFTLFVGNDNAKGEGAVRSASAQLGRPISAPQGTLRGFRGREIVTIPAPFGARAVFDFDSPEYDLLPGVASVQVKVGFESRLAMLGFAALARIPAVGGRAGGFLTQAGRVAPRSGHSGGAVMAELFYEDGSVRRASLSGATAGQRMAALPCALVAQALCRDGRSATGAQTAGQFLGAKALLDAIAVEGFSLAQDRIG